MNSNRLKIQICALLLFVVTLNIVQCQITRYQISDLGVFPKIVFIPSSTTSQGETHQELVLQFKIIDPDINTAKYFKLQILGADNKKIIEKKFKVTYLRGDIYLKNNKEIIPFTNNRISLSFQVPTEKWLKMDNLRLYFVDVERKTSNILEFSFIKMRL